MSFRGLQFTHSIRLFVMQLLLFSTAGFSESRLHFLCSIDYWHQSVEWFHSLEECIQIDTISDEVVEWEMSWKLCAQRNGMFLFKAIISLCCIMMIENGFDY